MADKHFHLKRCFLSFFRGVILYTSLLKGKKNLEYEAGYQVKWKVARHDRVTCHKNSKQMTHSKPYLLSQEQRRPQINPVCTMKFGFFGIPGAEPIISSGSKSSCWERRGDQSTRFLEKEFLEFGIQMIHLSAGPLRRRRNSEEVNHAWKESTRREILRNGQKLYFLCSEK